MRRHFFLWLGFVAMVTGMIFSACKTKPPYQAPPDLTTNKLYRNWVDTDTVSMADMPWNQIFTDTLLQRLISQAMVNNSDLRIADARIKKAEANFRQGKQGWLPTLDVSGNGAVQKLSAAQGGAFLPSQSYQFSLISSWELDLWGKMKSTKKAYLAQLMQSHAYRRAVQTQLVSDIAADYFSLLALDAQLAITEKTLENRIRDVNTVKVLKESDVVTGAAVVQSEANRYAAEVTIPDLKQRIRETENAISILLGSPPDSVRRSSLEEQQMSRELHTGLPVKLLANRPDVQEAEFRMRSDIELIHVAKAYFYPTLTITAQGGLSNGNIFQFLDASSIFGNIGAGLTQPIFNRGFNKQRLAIAEANQQESAISFEQSLLTAGKEVSDALYNFQAGKEKEALRTKQIGFLVKAVDFTKELLRYSSSTSFIDVLTSEQSLLAAQLNGVSDKLQQLQALVSLYRSLGGGWK